MIDYEGVWDLPMCRVYAIIDEMREYNLREDEKIKQWRNRH